MPDAEAVAIYESSGAFQAETHWRAKLSIENVREIKQLYRLGESKTSISKTYNISVNAISDIVNGLSWNHVNTDDDKTSRINVAAHEKFRTADCIKYSGSIENPDLGGIQNGLTVSKKFFMHTIWRGNKTTVRCRREWLSFTTADTSRV
ncbi:MAG TPA: hypothetical protein V6D22_04450 [Candidatus Obscuribacterales bacterium]